MPSTPIKIFTLGLFEIFKGEAPIRFQVKAPCRPWMLLKAILSLGGQAVCEEQACEILWPESEGDLAHQALATTLHRLRKRLGDGKTIALRDGKLSLNRELCWVDAWALEESLDQAEKILSHQKMPGENDAIDRALSLYRGPFLEGENALFCAISLRERLRSRLLRTLESLGRFLEEARAWEKAATYYRRGLEADPLAERFYRRLAVCYKHLGYPGEAIAIDHRRREIFAALLETAPSSGESRKPVTYL
ncbi:MAG: BTAD domain-containing putative transcriptional regulator [Candidatus Manganitrophaceae bacterium]